MERELSYSEEQMDYHYKEKMVQFLLPLAQYVPADSKVSPAISFCQHALVSILDQILQIMHTQSIHDLVSLLLKMFLTSIYHRRKWRKQDDKAVRDGQDDLICT